MRLIYYRKPIYEYFRYSSLKNDAVSKNTKLSHARYGFITGFSLKLKIAPRYNPLFRDRQRFDLAQNGR